LQEQKVAEMPFYVTKADGLFLE